MKRIKKAINTVKIGEEDLTVWLDISPEQKLSLVQELREEYMLLNAERLKERIERDESGKRLRRVYRIVKRT